MRNTRECVHDIAGFPGVVGCIDCTHIKIKNPGGSQAEVFKNRKRWFSLNIQAVGGPNLQLFDIVARWPGSSHDNFIYNSSSVKQRMLSREIEGLLLGDNGFALSPTLMTPFMSPSGSAQEIYNNAHIKTRNTIERAFGIWKRRFPCLQLGLNIKKETAVAVICACAALHNTALQYDDIQFEPDAVPDTVENNKFNREPENDNGTFSRESIVTRFFLIKLIVKLIEIIPEFCSELQRLYQTYT